MSIQSELKLWRAAIGPGGRLVVAAGLAVAVGCLIALYL